jgi:hypothetical protein
MASREIEARLELLETDFYEKGMMPRDRYLQRREGLMKRLQDARNAEADVGIDLPRELAEHLGERFPAFTLANQRRIIAAVIDKIVVARAKSHGPIDESRVDVAGGLLFSFHPRRIGEGPRVTARGPSPRLTRLLFGRESDGE